MREALGRGWEVCPGHAPSVRAMLTLPTPDWARWPRKAQYGGHVWPARWPVDTFEALVFVTFSPSWKTAQAIIGVADGPGGGRTDRMVSLRRAAEVLADPSVVSSAFEGWNSAHGLDTHDAGG